MGRRRFFGQKEVDIKLRPRARGACAPADSVVGGCACGACGSGGESRRQAWGSLGGGQAWREVALDPHVYSRRRSVVKASFKRNDHSGGVGSARPLPVARQERSSEQGKGRGFDAEREGIDMVALVRDWEKQRRAALALHRLA